MDDYSTVIIAQHPTKMGENGPEKMHLDLSDAERYGEVVEVLSTSAKPFDVESVRQLDNYMKNASPDAWLLCVGNPTLIAAAAASFCSYHERVNLLQWQSRKRRYEAVTIFLGTGDSDRLDVVNGTMGEDDE